LEFSTFQIYNDKDQMTGFYVVSWFRNECYILIELEKYPVTNPELPYYIALHL